MNLIICVLKAQLGLASIAAPVGVDLAARAS